MKLGIIADTHDNVPNVQRAVEVFNTHNVGLVAHCGDYVAPFSLGAYEKLRCDWVGVFGNNDGEREGLLRRSKGRIKDAPYIFSFGTHRIAVVHELCACDAGIILFGHSHKAEIRKGIQLSINPGEAGGWLFGQPSVGILDLYTLEARIVPLV